MAQQTAVEWLEQHIKELETKLFNFKVSPLESPTIREGLYKQAKQMEKEQMKEMYLKGIENYDPTFKRKSQWTEVTESTFNSYRRVK